MNRWSPGFYVVALALFVTAACGEEPGSVISRVPPPAYQELLEPRLTKLEEVQSLPKAPADNKGDAATETLLDETLIVLQDDGRYLAATHTIHAVLSDEGVKYLGESDSSFLRSQEKLHVALARTIRPDGTFIPAEEKGMFLKRTGANEGTMHTDSDTLHIVFPEVSVGSLVERILVKEVLSPTIPGEFVWQHPGCNLGGTRRQRVVIDVSEALLSRLRWDGLGMAIPSPAKTSSGDGRTRLEWHIDRLRPLSFESGGPPISQVGPLWRISTVGGWDEIGRWFADLVKENAGSAALPQTTAREWAAGTNEPQGIARKLFDNVRQQVRYTGLEFGKGRYQPRSPEDVLSTRYGDCKDKANLLRVLLQEHGIESRIALLNTAHSGHIDRKYPSPYQFNHAILAVKVPGREEYQFCDPSVDGAGFGQLSPSTVDREALLVKEDGSVEWVRTPAMSFGRQDIAVDFQLEPGGGFSGWLTLKVDGYFGTLLGHDLAKASRPSALATLTGIYFTGIENASVLDYEILKDDGSDDQQGLRLRAYVVKEGAAVEPNAGNERALFPQLPSLLPKVGQVPARTTPMRGLAIETHIHGGYRMPNGWKVLDTPAAFKRSPGNATFAVRWSTDTNGLNFDATMVTKDLVISPERHRELWNVRRDLIAWAGRPVLIKVPEITEKTDSEESEEEGGEAKRWAPPADSLPKLATAQGQLELVNKRFPFDPNNPFTADHTARKIAMQKVVEFFPDDPVAQFQAGVMKLLSELFEFESEDLTDRARELIDKYSAHIDADHLEAGKLMLAATLAAAEKNEEALPLALAVADGEGAPMIRRGGAMIACGILVNSDPQRAATYARRVLADGASLPTVALTEASGVMLFSLLRQPGVTAEAVMNEWQTLAAQFRTQTEELREVLVVVLEALLEEGRIPEAELLTGVTNRVLESAGEAEELREAFQEFQEQLTRAKGYAPAHEKLVSELRSFNWPDLEKVEPGHSMDTVSDCSSAIYSTEQHDLRFRYALRRLTSYGSQPDLPAYLREAAEFANGWLKEVADDKKPSTPETAEKLEQLINLFVKTEIGMASEAEERADIALFKGEIVGRRSGKPAAIKYYRSLATEENSTAELRAEAHQAAAELLAEAGDFRGVLAEWKAMQAQPDQEYGYHIDLRAVYLNLLIADKKEAWRHITNFVARDDETLTRSAKKAKDLFGEMLKNKASAEAWWEQSNSWWSKWETLRKDAGIDDGQSYTQNPWGTWMSPLEKLPDSGDPSEDPEDSMMLPTVVQSIMTRARWHRELTGEAVTLLREYIGKRHPSQQAATEEIAQAMETAAKAI